MEMEKKNTMNRIQQSWVIVLIAMLISMFSYTSATVFADTTATMTVKNVEAGATVKAYKIVKEGENGDWTAVLKDSIEDPIHPTADEITTLAGKTGSLGTPINMEKSGDNYVGQGEPGMYLVLVSKTDSTKVYNPMIVSVNYKSGATLEGGSVDANSNFKITDVAYAKSSTPTLDKKITGKTNNSSVTGDDTAYGDTLKPGDKTSFEITTTIPSYSKQYQNSNLKFEIKDTVSEGLNAPTDIVVKEGTKILEKGEGEDYTLVQDGKTFTIKFTNKYLLSGNAAKNITVTYKAELNNSATVGFDANTNKAKLEYSDSPSTINDKKEKTTYHYTFDIDGDVMGSKNIKGEEIIKVGVDKTSGELITKKESTGSSTTTTPLKGAKFTLYVAGADGEKTNVVAGTAETGSDGLMHFSKLDAGKYVLVETEAPKGYVKNDTEVPVEISATLNANGTLASYSVKIDNKITSTYEGKYDGGTVVNTVDKTGDTALFNNYKPGGLPSTGGMGTYIFMIIGGALIALAAALYAKNRKRQAE
ncbi:fimbrial protein [Hornefia porci]|uniref:Fimbrial protein n=2 Tax=Hornefia porci TaxID=2652292 RepID=A0A1Q9JL88_9FIRM|nr:fimbrial protein [Hornefia porci]